ncbi:cyclase family protein [Herbiconiux sp. P17]|uniref:cyclase family protein n=1 Tax=Herbiconiux wuyangfengii TaxID=3342794 RepID=UPI0035BA488F
MTEPADRAPADVVPRPYGDDDVIGAVNEITPERVAAAAALVTTGRSYSLAQVLDSASPAQMWRFWKQELLTDRTTDENSFGSNRQTFVEESLSGALHSGTHLDGLAHIGIGGYAYGGRPWGVIAHSDGLTELGIENLPPITTRGVLLDVAAVHGVDLLGDDEGITGDDLEAAARRAGVRVRSGDVVIVHTGWGALWDADPERYNASEPGLVTSAARWCIDRRVTVIGADNWAVERVPLVAEDEAFPVHQETITRNGVYLLENVRTAELVADGVSEFFCVISPIRMRGASGSMVNPVALV